MKKEPCVYILMNDSGTIYIGVTICLERRVKEHFSGKIKGFTKKYKVNKLVYFEKYKNIKEALAREKQLKNWHREWKLNLISKFNPEFNELLTL